MARWAILLLLFSNEPAVRIHVAASKGRIIPQSKGGGGFERTFLFTAAGGQAGRWIRQTLEVRGTVFDAKGRTAQAHLDVIEYYRVGAKGRSIQTDSHYSQYWNHAGGDLTIRATLTYGTLTPKKRGDTIMGKSFILRSATDKAGKVVTMRKRINREVIPAEHGKRVAFKPASGIIATKYAYRIRWDTRGSRTKPAGAIDVGTWHFDLPEQTGPTRAAVRPDPIPRIKR